MKQEKEDDEDMTEIEAPKFEEQLGGVETLYFDEAFIVPNMNDEKEPPKRLPTKSIIDYRRKYPDSFITEAVSMNCDVCEEKLKSWEDALNHHKSVHNQAGYLKCCGRKFKTKYRLTQHIEYHQGKHKCEHCSKIYSSSTSLKTHIELTHVKQTRFQCKVCSTSFSNYYQLTSHIKKDHAPGPPIIKKGLPTRVKNKKQAVKEKPTEKLSCFCELCGKEYKDKWILKSHLRLYHSDPNERSQCTICGHFLKNAVMLRRHKAALHKTDEQAFTCETCGKKCPSKGALIGHRRIKHLLEANFNCSFCDKKFKQKIDLKEHEATHRGIDLYKCEWCGAGFKLGGSFRAHRKNAHPEHYDKVKPYWLKSNDELVSK